MSKEISLLEKKLAILRLERQKYEQGSSFKVIYKKGAKDILGRRWKGILKGQFAVPEDVILKYSIKDGNSPIELFLAGIPVPNILIYKEGDTISIDISGDSIQAKVVSVNKKESSVILSLPYLGSGNGTIVNQSFLNIIKTEANKIRTEINKIQGKKENFSGQELQEGIIVPNEEKNQEEVKTFNSNNSNNKDRPMPEKPEKNNIETVLNIALMGILAYSIYKIVTIKTN